MIYLLLSLTGFVADDCDVRGPISSCVCRVFGFGRSTRRYGDCRWCIARSISGNLSRNWFSWRWQHLHASRHTAPVQIRVQSRFRRSVRSRCALTSCDLASRLAWRRLLEVRVEGSRAVLRDFLKVLLFFVFSARRLAAPTVCNHNYIFLTSANVV